MPKTEKTESGMRIEYERLSAILKAPRNPKKHDAKQMDASVRRFGFADPPTVDERTGKLVEGHGRLEALQRMKDAGKEPPGRILAAGDGEWLVPIVRGVHFKNDREAEAYLLAHNRIGETLWDDVELAAVLADHREDISGLGWTEDEIVSYLDEDEAGGDLALYTKKIKAPVYEPKMTEPPPVSELVNEAKAHALMEEIEKAEDLPLDVRLFLTHAAARHNVFDYEKIAEFYAHAPKRVQELMEKSALVIIDFNKAIENGFVQLSEELGEAYEDSDEE